MLLINEASHSGHLLAAQRNVYANARSSETNDVHGEDRCGFTVSVEVVASLGTLLVSSYGQPESMKWRDGKL